jgi:hypothetical protein
MLKSRMRAFGAFAAGGFVIAWGSFYLLTLPPGDIPRELLWLGAVLAVGVSLAAGALAYMRARGRARGE